MLVNSADRGSSAWYIGDPGTHDPTMDAPCEAPAACRDSILDNAHVVPTLHIIYLHVHETWKGRFARACGCMIRIENSVRVTLHTKPYIVRIVVS